MEDYLETILILQKKSGMVLSIDVARYMGFSKPSVCHAVKLLREKGCLDMDKDGILHLTEYGRDIAENIYERHCFFTKHLTAMGVLLNRQNRMLARLSISSVKKVSRN